MNYNVRLEILTTVILKSSVFWDITLCSPLKEYACCLLHAGFLRGLFFDPEDGDYVFFQNIG
jgi:hypothetical protein